MHKRTVQKTGSGSHEDTLLAADRPGQSLEERWWPKHGALVGLALGGMACLLWLGSRAAFASGPAAAKVSRMLEVADYSLGPNEAELVVARMNAFGLSLLSSLYSRSGGTSVFISPLSIANVLGMVSLGTTQGGAAEKEVHDAWRMEERVAVGFLSDFHLQLVELAASSEKIDLINANSMWCKSSIKGSYTEVVQQRLHAEARPLPADAKPINAWCSEATKGMIPIILNDIDPLTVAVLVNAVYFKGMWAEKFGRTLRGTFTSAHKGAQPCAMMLREDKKMLYLERQGVQVVELPYGSEDGRLSAVVLLPPKKADAEEEPLAELIRRLGASDGADSLMQDLEDLRPAPVELRLPRFEVEFSLDLSSELQSTFGMRQTFGGSEQFLRMSDDPDVHLSKVIHKAKVEVSEEGTRAAAATAAVMMVRSLPMPPPDQARVIVDRPFLFLIRDKVTGAFLFVGAVEDPKLDTTGI